jgi:hypothetical protein
MIGPLDLDWLNVRCRVSFVGCALAHGMSARAATIPALRVRHCQLGVLARRDARIDGVAVDLRDARIDGDMSIVMVHRSGAVHADGVSVRGALYIGNTSLTGVRVVEDGPYASPALDLSGAHIDGPVGVYDFRSEGPVHAVGAKFNRGLRMRATTLCNPGGSALNLTAACIEHDAELKRLAVSGAVDLSAARIRGSLSFTGTEITKPYAGIALSLTAPLPTSTSSWRTSTSRAPSSCCAQPSPAASRLTAPRCGRRAPTMRR